MFLLWLLFFSGCIASVVESNTECDSVCQALFYGEERSADIKTVRCKPVFMPMGNQLPPPTLIEYSEKDREEILNNKMINVSLFIAWHTFIWVAALSNN